jgi:hypothetical protein
MSNVIDFSSYKARRQKEQTKFAELVHEDPFLRYFSDGRVEYTEAGVAEFEDAFRYAGFDIHSIETIQGHAKALDGARFSKVPPFEC